MFKPRTVLASTLVTLFMLAGAVNAQSFKPSKNIWINVQGDTYTVCYLYPPKGFKTEFKLDGWSCYTAKITGLSPKKKKEYGIS